MVLLLQISFNQQRGLHLSRLSAVMVVQLGLSWLEDDVWLLMRVSLRGVTVAATISRADSRERAGRGDRAGTSAIASPLWSYLCSSHTEVRDTAEGFSPTA